MSIQLFKIATQSLTASAGSITFNSIPQGYTDLLLKISTRTDYASVNDNLKITYNSLATSFSMKRLYGSGSAAGSDSASDNTGSIVTNGTSSTSSTFNNTDLYIPNYTSSNYKSYSIDSVSETNATGTYMYLIAGLWSNTAAITSIGLLPQAGTNILQYSTVTLYGIL